MLAPLLAAVLFSTTPNTGLQSGPAQVQPAIPSANTPTDLEDVVVEGRRLNEQVQSFVREVGQPSNGRGLARWRNGLCAGVANLETDAAQYLVDRVSDVARDLGLRAGAPGCAPNVLIIVTPDAQAFTPQFVALRPRAFRVGGSGMDTGSSGLRAFENSDAAVRWWHVSVPVDQTGEIAVRLPGYCGGICESRDGNPMNMAPHIKAVASRLLSSTEDDMQRVLIIVDADKISGVDLDQLGDYVAMIALAQINPEADTTGYSSVLNLFNDPEHTPGLTNWDRTYLEGLYGAVRTRLNRNTARGEIASSIIRAHHRLVAREDEQP